MLPPPERFHRHDPPCDSVLACDPCYPRSRNLGMKYLPFSVSESAEAIRTFSKRLHAIAPDLYGEDLKVAVEQVRRQLLEERGQKWLDRNWCFCWNNLLAADAVIGLGLHNEKIIEPPALGSVCSTTLRTCLRPR